MEGPTSSGGSRNRLTCLTLQEHDDDEILLLLLLLSSSSSSSSSSPLCRVFILIFLRQTMSLENTVLQLFCCYYSWCLFIVIIIIIITIIIIIPVIPSMHGIYSYVPQTNPVSTVYSVAAGLYVQSVLHVMLFGMLNMFCTFTSALPTVHNMAGFCSPLISCLLLLLLLLLM